MQILIDIEDEYKQKIFHIIEDQLQSKFPPKIKKNLTAIQKNWDLSGALHGDQFMGTCTSKLTGEVVSLKFWLPLFEEMEYFSCSCDDSKTAAGACVHIYRAQKDISEALSTEFEEEQLGFEGATKKLFQTTNHAPSKEYLVELVEDLGIKLFELPMLEGGPRKNVPKSLWPNLKETAASPFVSFLKPMNATNEISKKEVFDLLTNRDCGTKRVLHRGEIKQLKIKPIELYLRKFSDKLWDLAFHSDKTSETLFVDGQGAVIFTETVVMCVAFDERQESILRELKSLFSKPFDLMGTKGLPEFLMQASKEIKFRCDDTQVVDLSLEPALRFLPKYRDQFPVQVVLRSVDGSEFQPGVGGADLLDISGNHLKVLKRNFLLEQESYREVVEQLALEEFQSFGEFYYFIAGELQLIEFIERLRTHFQGLELLWPESSLFKKVKVETAQKEDLKIEAIEAGRQDWFDLRVFLKSGDHSLDIAEILTALHGRKKYIKINDDLWIKISEQLRKFVMERAGIFARQQISMGEKIFIEDRDEPLKANKKKVQDFALSEDFQATLHDYQGVGYQWICKTLKSHQGACLADDMGMGKTIQAIAVICSKLIKGRVLIVAPASLEFNWNQELSKFAPHIPVSLYRSARGLGKNQDTTQVDIVSYGMLSKSIESLSKEHYSLLIFDEAQNIKNHASQRFKALQCIEADYRLALTGTPIENKASDLWSILNITNPGLFGGLQHFKQTVSGQQDQPLLLLKKLVAPFVLRRKKKDYLKQLPEKNERRISLQLSKKEQALYDEYRLLACAKLKGDQEEADMIHILSTLHYMRQMLCHPSLVDETWKDHATKFEAICDYMEVLSSRGRRVLLFSQFTRFLGMFAERFKKQGYRYEYFDGQTPVKKRQSKVEAFQNREFDIFLISLKAGGVGLNLTAADTVILADSWWNPAVENQAIDRAYRIGQEQDVEVVRFIVHDTLEEKIQTMQQEKNEIANTVLTLDRETVQRLL